jgi:hypothetical protein
VTVALAITTVTDNVGGLSVTGADILDIDEIPESVDGRKPIIFPKPDGFVTDLEVTRQSYGASSDAKTDMEYTLNYRLCHTPVGSGRGLFKTYPDMVTIAARFMDAIANYDATTAVTLELADAINFGPVSDPAGNMFHGCDFALRVKEFQN